MSAVASPQAQNASSSAHDSSLEETQDSFGFTSFRTKNSTAQNDKASTNNQPIQQPAVGSEPFN